MNLKRWAEQPGVSRGVLAARLERGGDPVLDPYAVVGHRHEAGVVALDAVQVPGRGWRHGSGPDARAVGRLEDLVVGPVGRCHRRRSKTGRPSRTAGVSISAMPSPAVPGRRARMAGRSISVAAPTR